MISIHRLEGFHWVARTGGYARAARAFPYPITQPAVHQQVKKLETELGVTLFERVGKETMALTPAGRRLAEFVRPFFDGLPAVVRSVQGGHYGGELSIHTATLFLRHLMPAWVKRLHKRHPDLRVMLEETPAPDIEGLRRGAADLVVDHLPEIPDDIATLQVATMRPFVVYPRPHPKVRADAKRVPLERFTDDTFIAYTPGNARELQLRALAQHDVSPARMLSASSAEGILGFVESNLGWSIVPSLESGGPRGKGFAAMPLRPGKIEFPVVAAWRKDTPENPLLDAALEEAPRP